MDRLGPLAALTIACGLSTYCGAGTVTSPEPTPNPPVSLLKASGQVVNVLGGAPSAGASLSGNGFAVATNSTGEFEILSGIAGAYSVTLSQNSFIERRTSVQVPAEALRLSIIPASFDLAAFEEFAPRIGGLQRWVANPTLMILTNVVDYSTASDSFREFTVTDHSLSTQNGACLRVALQSSLTDLTGGRLQFSSVIESTRVVGNRVRTDTTPDGTIIVMAASNLDLAGRAIAYVSASSTHVLNRGAIFIRETAPYCDPANGPHLIGHELGHALGYAYNHVTRVPSIMSITPSTITQGVSSFDRDAIEVLFQRPPGNRAPDTDLSAAALSKSQASLTRVVREPIR